MLRNCLRLTACALAAGAFVVLAGSGSPASAEEAEGIGIRAFGPTVGFQSSDNFDQFTVGGMLDLGTIAPPIGLLFFADLGFGDDATTLIAGPSIVGRVALEGAGTVYGGINLGLAYINIDIPQELQDIADQFGQSIDDSSTDFVAALDLGYIHPLSGGGLLVDLRIGLVDEHPDFKGTVGYVLARGN